MAVLAVAAAVVAATLAAGPLARAGTPSNPEVVDPQGDHLGNLQVVPPNPPLGVVNADAMDLRKAWILHPDPAFAANIRFWVNTTSLHEPARGGAFLEEAGWVVRFNASGASFAVMTRQVGPCGGTGPLGVEACVTVPAYLQPRRFCHDGAEEDVPVSVAFNETRGLSFGFPHAAIGSPGLGETIDGLVAEVRRFPQGEGFSCSLEGSERIDRAPDAGSGACTVRLPDGCQPSSG